MDEEELIRFEQRLEALLRSHGFGWVINESNPASGSREAMEPRARVALLLENLEAVAVGLHDLEAASLDGFRIGGDPIALIKLMPDPTEDRVADFVRGEAIERDALRTRSESVESLRAVLAQVSAAVSRDRS